MLARKAPQQVTVNPRLAWGKNVITPLPQPPVTMLHEATADAEVTLEKCYVTHCCGIEPDKLQWRGRVCNLVKCQRNTSIQLNRCDWPYCKMWRLLDLGDGRKRYHRLIHRIGLLTKKCISWKLICLMDWWETRSSDGRVAKSAVLPSIYISFDYKWLKPKRTP